MSTQSLFRASMSLQRVSNALGLSMNALISGTILPAFHFTDRLYVSPLDIHSIPFSFPVDCVDSCCTSSTGVSTLTASLRPQRQ